MPLYEFKCDDCGYLFEKLCFKPEDERDVKCSRCGSKKVVKVLSSFSGFFSSRGFGYGGASSCGGGRGFGFG